jgi:hypothetical protein
MAPARARPPHIITPPIHPRTPLVAPPPPPPASPPLPLQFLVRRRGLDLTKYGTVDARKAKRMRIGGAGGGELKRWLVRVRAVAGSDCNSKVLALAGPFARATIVSCCTKNPAVAYLNLGPMPQLTQHAPLACAPHLPQK